MIGQCENELQVSLVIVVKDHISLWVKPQGRQAVDCYLVGLRDLGQYRFGTVCIIVVGGKSGEAENGGAVGGVTDAGKGQ